jgi:hypothetical protein
MPDKFVKNEISSRFVVDIINEECSYVINKINETDCDFMDIRCVMLTKGFLKTFCARQ